ncbi:MAG: hypothetical protein R3E01_32640 [Pirellulaceae bacterium]|nr:hypothetical protein [Planctomycetales bacterium]
MNTSRTLAMLLRFDAGYPIHCAKSALLSVCVLLSFAAADESYDADDDTYAGIAAPYSSPYSALDGVALDGVALDGVVLEGAVLEGAVLEGAALDDPDDTYVMPTQATQSLLGGFLPLVTSPARFGQTDQLRQDQNARNDYVWSSTRMRLAPVPEMFGDFFFRGGSIAFGPFAAGGPTVGIPVAGGSRRMLVAEHNRALPTDRVFFDYNHYHNAYEFVTPAGLSHLSVDRLLFGAEKTFWNGLASVELRLPFTGDVDFTDAASGVGVDGGNVGNLSVIFKGVMTTYSDSILSAGLGLDLPTGSDALLNFGAAAFEVQDDIVYLSPFLAWQQRNGCRSFLNAFAQVDAPLGGNRLFVDNRGITPNASLGRINEQTLLHLNASWGHWLWQNDCRFSRGLTSLAALLELHYVATLDDAATLATAGITAGETRNRTQIVNTTLGAHSEFNQHTSLRVGAVFPLTEAPERLFDAELTVQLRRRF